MPSLRNIGIGAGIAAGAFGVSGLQTLNQYYNPRAGAAVEAGFLGSVGYGAARLFKARGVPAAFYGAAGAAIGWTHSMRTSRKLRDPRIGVLQEVRPATR